MKVSIVIPVYNEEKTISKIIEKVNRVDLSTLHLKKEIIIVDDGSSDKTKDILKNVKNAVVCIHKKNQGKGAAIRTGIKKVTGDIVIIQDADLEYSPDDYKKLLMPILKGKSKVVYGSRFMNYKPKFFNKAKKDLVLHYLGNKFLTFVTRVLYKSNITDMETCYKVFRKEVLKGIKLESNRFNFEPEITAKICKKKYKIEEVPISFKPRSFEEGKKINIKDGIIALFVLIKYRFF